MIARIKTWFKIRLDYIFKCAQEGRARGYRVGYIKGLIQGQNPWMLCYKW